MEARSNPAREEEVRLARHFLVLEGPNFKRTVDLTEPAYSIGRHPSNSIVIPSEQISRYQATIIRRTDSQNNYSYWIIDGDLQGRRSTNGIYINDKKCFVHELNHGDNIKFSPHTKSIYYVLYTANLDSQIDFLVYSRPEERILQAELLQKACQQTVVTSELDGKQMSQEELVRLASFPELSPSPIVEIDFAGKITYLNSAASLKFNSLKQAGLEHPILQGLLDTSPERNGKLLIREVKIGNEVYEQYVHYLFDRNSIRSYLYDFTGRKRAEIALRASEERYRTVVKQASEGIVLVDAASKRILEANPAFCRLLGYTNEELLELTIDEILVLRRQEIDRQLQQVATQTDWMTQAKHRKKDGSFVDVEVSGSVIHYGEKASFCFVVRDITQRRQWESFLQYQSCHDPLTGLPNRAWFEEQLKTALANAKRYNHQMALMGLDLNDFKTVNETLGYSAGDRLLQSFAERLKTCLRAGDAIARWGGDSFTILLGYINSAEDAAKVCQRILETLRQPFELDNYQLHLKCSIGIAAYPRDGTTVEMLLKHTDTALSRAKDNISQPYRFYSPKLSSNVSARLKLENLLHQALKQKEFSIDYQPQINLKAGQIQGLEALLRWHHPKFGPVPPGKFIPLAEKTELILPIGEWVLRTACTQNKLWQEAGLPPMRVSVNLSPRQFLQPNLIALVEQVLNQTGLDPQWLDLEITETALMQDVESAGRTLHELQVMGVRTSMDDFGTGYSSLSYLKQLPFHALKIDRSFVHELTKDFREQALVSAIVALGQALNLRVVAEGVETSEQLRILRRLQCLEMQGYRFCPPLRVNKVTRLLYRLLKTIEGRNL